ncbi:MAG: helical backbone metal receptor [Desulfosarcinaceae bacterium]
MHPAFFSLVPSITEILFAIGAGDTVMGVTYHDTYPPEAALCDVVGGFFAPSISRIRQIGPEIVFVSDLHRDVVSSLENTKSECIHLKLGDTRQLAQAITLLGRLFDKPKEAAALNSRIDAAFEQVRRKTDRLGNPNKKRVARIMGIQPLMVPGDDSFQNDLIRRAGGIPPVFNKQGKIVPITQDEWKAFNPQVVYGCGHNPEVLHEALSQAGWKDVDAVKNGKILSFSCDLTCRLSSRAGFFVSLLAEGIYADMPQFRDAASPDEIMGSRLIDLEVSYLEKAEIIDIRLHDYAHQAMVLQFKKPMSVTSTLEGFRKGIRHVGNSFSPPQVWRLYHRTGWENSRNRLLRALGKSPEDTSLLNTGVPMDNLSIRKQSFEKLTVYALVTAGAKSNTLRSGVDTGSFYEPATINIILLANARLAPRAMSRALITATEAKTAALWDLDIRSSQTPLVNPATGTGTDNIIVIEGAGPGIDMTGGHTKMGELIAKAVYAGVQDAIFRQNGLVRTRSVFRQLQERRIRLFGLVKACDCRLKGNEIKAALEQLLLQPRYAGFLEAAFALSDAHERGLVEDLSSFAAWCGRIRREVAGETAGEESRYELEPDLPPVLKMALEALVNGVGDKLAASVPDR